MQANDEMRMLKDQVELFLLCHPGAFLCDVHAGLFPMTDVQYSLEVQFQKLILTVWNADRSLTRRIFGVIECESERMVLEVGHGPAPRFEVELDARPRVEEMLKKAGARKDFCQKMRRWLRSRFPDLCVESLTVSKDLSHSLSERYARGWGIEKGLRWALLGVNPAEDQAAVDACLSFALIWLDHLRLRSHRQPLAGLKVIVPVGRSGTVESRAAFLCASGLHLDVLEYDSETGALAMLETRDFGNRSTRLSQVDRVPLPAEQIPLHFLPAPILSHLDQLQIVHRPASRMFSVRFRGLEFARLSDDRSHRFSFGVGSEDIVYRENLEEDLIRLLEDLQRFRRHDGPDRSHPFFRLQAERWLESLILQDIRQVRQDLDPAFVYPQVPAFSGLDRGVIDILTMTRERRLAVLELKVAEDINLPLQALDYWTRVKWHQERGDFKRQGYFAGLDVGSASPLLFLVSPAFRFHSTTEGILKYFHEDLEVIKVAVNESWRKGIEVMFRRKIG